MDERNVIGQMTGLATGESFGKEMIFLFQEISQSLEIFGEKESSFSYELIDPPNDSKIFRPSKN